jgi:hypothetical protein
VQQQGRGNLFVITFKAQPYLQHVLCCSSWAGPLRGCTKEATGNQQLFAKERVLNQSTRNRGNLNSEGPPLAEVVLADHRVFRNDLMLTGVLPILIVFPTINPIGTFHLFPSEAA